MSSSPNRDSESPIHLLDRMGLILRPNDQVTLFVIAIICVAILGSYFVRLYWLHGNLIDVDQMDYRAAAYRVDINKADWPEIANIPNIGQKLAKAVVAYRDEHGDFATVSSLKRVPGIGPSKLTSLRQFVLPLESEIQTDSPSRTSNNSRE